MARLAPKFVKPYVKNPKNDMADAGPIAEAPSRPTMRLVEVNTPEQQGLRVIFRLRDLLVGQRTQTVNALPGHLAEFGIVTAKGRENADKLRSALDRDEEAADTSATVRHMAQLSFDQINGRCCVTHA
jgi:transposase